MPDAENDLVPNLFPKVEPTERRLAVIGEAPGADEVVAKEPFVGTSGRFLRALLANAGVSCNQTFFGNICQHHPPSNDIDYFSFDGPEIQTGLERLRTDLQVFHPNCVLLLGRTALRTGRPDLCYPGKKGYVIPLADWRGSLFVSEVLGGYKCVGSYHPAYILRSYGDIPYLKFDISRAAKHALAPALSLPVISGDLRPTLVRVLSFFEGIRLRRDAITWDIEGYADDVGITMFSVIIDSTKEGLVIPFYLSGANYWSEDEEVQIWKATAELMFDDQIRKTAHQAFYELFVSAWRHGMVINNLYDDTMQKHWEIFPEAGGDPDSDVGDKKSQGLGRSLADCASIYTEIPFWKDNRLSENPDVKLQYNFTDSYATVCVNDAEEKVLQKTPRSLAHYRFNISLVPPYNYLMLRGCRFDTSLISTIKAGVEQDIADLNSEIQTSLGREFNCKSGVDKQWLLYDHLGYTPLKKYTTPKGKPGTSEDVILHFWKKHDLPILRLVIRNTRKRTRLSDINKLVPNKDGRIRSSYDPVGTNTGRLSSKSSQVLERTPEGWDNTGTNLQNVTKDLRVCFIPDSPDKEFWQLDLVGSDGWTVAAELAALGQSTMLDDYLAGIKPALVLHYMLDEFNAGRDAAKVNLLNRDELKQRLSEVRNRLDSLEGKNDSSGRPLDWLYLCCKRVQHGSNYGARPEKVSEVIFGDSDGTISLSPRDAGLYQYFYKLRYKTDARNDWIRRELTRDGFLVASCGIKRQFFGIRNRREIDDAVVREASAFNPQANTTWATNKALANLWYDKENRTSRGSLFIEPLLQVHDALCGQYKIEHREFAHRKLREWFQNPITIAKTSLTIPADGKYGPNWKDCKTPIL